jgi:hypothetical protein
LPFNGKMSRHSSGRGGSIHRAGFAAIAATAFIDINAEALHALSLWIYRFEKPTAERDGGVFDSVHGVDVLPAVRAE